MRDLLDQVIETDYGQFDLVWDGGGGFDGVFETFFAGQVNGLVGAASRDGLYAHFGRRSGGSHVRITLLDSAPDDPESQWEDVVEVSVWIPQGADPSWVSWAGESTGSLALPAGTYRVRVSACGRDEGSGEGELADGVVDSYLFEFWSAPAGRDAVLRSTSNDAAYWHREVGSNR